MNRALAVLLVAAGVASGGEFDRVANAIEKHYGVKRTHIPMMGVADLFLNVAHPAGTTGFTSTVAAPARSESMRAWGFRDAM